MGPMKGIPEYQAPSWKIERKVGRPIRDHGSIGLGGNLMKVGFCLYTDA